METYWKIGSILVDIYAPHDQAIYVSFFETSFWIFNLPICHFCYFFSCQEPFVACCQPFCLCRTQVRRPEPEPRVLTVANTQFKWILHEMFTFFCLTQTRTAAYVFWQVNQFTCVWIGRIHHLFISPKQLGGSCNMQNAYNAPPNSILYILSHQAIVESKSMQFILH